MKIMKWQQILFIWIIVITRIARQTYQVSTLVLLELHSLQEYSILQVITVIVNLLAIHFKFKLYFRWIKQIKNCRRNWRDYRFSGWEWVKFFFVYNYRKYIINIPIACIILLFNFHKYFISLLKNKKCLDIKPGISSITVSNNTPESNLPNNKKMLNLRVGKVLKNTKIDFLLN